MPDRSIGQLRVSLGQAPPVIENSLPSSRFLRRVTFDSDTKYVESETFDLDPNHSDCLSSDTQPPCVDVNIIQTGTASVTIVSTEKVVHATFVPGQIFVSIDLGRTIEEPHLDARGIGFGSMSATSFEPAYPLGVNEGPLHWDFSGHANHGLPSPQVITLSNDLQHDTGFSGEAWPCVGFPNVCQPPTALHTTDKGDLYLYLPYWLRGAQMPGFPPPPSGAVAEEEANPSLMSGFFMAKVGEPGREDSLPFISGRLAASERRGAKPITYNAYTLADVSIGGQFYSNAQIYLSLNADASTVHPLNGSPRGYKNESGAAHATVISGGNVISADFNPGQIYVYYDLTLKSIGFGSMSGGPNYPLSLTPGVTIMSGFGSVFGVADLTLKPQDATLYSDPMVTLKTDLTNATTLVGTATSCVAFDPVTGYCPMSSILSPVALKTNRGRLLHLSELHRRRQFRRHRCALDRLWNFLVRTGAGCCRRLGKGRVAHSSPGSPDSTVFAK